MNLAGAQPPLHTPTLMGAAVAISLSITILLFIVLVVMYYTGSLRPGGAFFAALFGFCLASTGLAPAINQFLSSAAAAIGHIHL